MLLVLGFYFLKKHRTRIFSYGSLDIYLKRHFTLTYMSVSTFSQRNQYNLFFHRFVFTFYPWGLAVADDTYMILKL